jgi:hypothetical protein
MLLKRKDNASAKRLASPSAIIGHQLSIKKRKGADFRPRPASAYPRAPLLHVIVEERHFPFSSAPATFDEIFSPTP